MSKNNTSDTTQSNLIKSVVFEVNGVAIDVDHNVNARQMSIAELIKVDRDVQGNTALHKAVKLNDVETVQKLMKFGIVNVANALGYTPLHSAAYAGHVEIAEILIKAGADVNAQTKLGKTPLWWAADQRHAKMVELLLRSGADANIRCNASHGGSTPLYPAVWRGSRDIVEMLIPHISDLNEPAAWCKTYLQVAISNNHTDIASLLSNSQNQRSSKN